MTERIRTKVGREVSIGLEGLPAVGGVTGDDVLGEGDVGVVLDGDRVVVPEDDEVAELLGARQRGRLRGDALLDVTVGGDDVDVVVERGLAGRGLRVEQAALAAGRHRHTDGGRQALTQRAGGDLDTGGVADFRVPRGERAPRTQCLEVVELQTEPTEVELDVLGQ